MGDSLRLDFVLPHGTSFEYRTKLHQRDPNRQWSVSMDGKETDVPCPLHLVACALPNSRFVGSGAMFGATPMYAEVVVTTSKTTRVKSVGNQTIAIPAFELGVDVGGLVKLKIDHDPTVTTTDAFHNTNARWLLVDLMRKLDWVAKEARPGDALPVRMVASVVEYGSPYYFRKKELVHVLEGERVSLPDEEADQLTPHSVTFRSFDFSNSFAAAASIAQAEGAIQPEEQQQQDDDEPTPAHAFGTPLRDAHTHACLRQWCPKTQWDATVSGHLRPKADMGMNLATAMRNHSARANAIPRRAQSQLAQQPQTQQQQSQSRQVGECFVREADVGLKSSGVKISLVETLHSFWGNYPTDFPGVDVGDLSRETFRDCLVRTSVTFTTRNPKVDDKLNKQLATIREFVAKNPTLPREANSRIQRTQNLVYDALAHLSTLLDMTTIGPNPNPAQPLDQQNRELFTNDSVELRHLVHLMNRHPGAFNIKRAIFTLDKGGQFSALARRASALFATVQAQFLPPPAPPAPSMPLNQQPLLPRLLGMLSQWSVAGWASVEAELGTDYPLAQELRNLSERFDLAPPNTTLEIVATCAWKIPGDTTSVDDVAVGVSNAVFVMAAQRALVRCFFMPDSDALDLKNALKQTNMVARFGSVQRRRRRRDDGRSRTVVAATDNRFYIFGGGNTDAGEDPDDEEVQDYD